MPPLRLCQNPLYYLKTSALATFRELDGITPFERAITLSDQAIRILETQVHNGRQSLRTNHAWAIAHKATLLKDSGDPAAALRLLEEAGALLREVGPTLEDLAEVDRKRAMCYGQLGDKQSAIAAYEQASVIMRSLHRWDPNQDVSFYKELIDKWSKSEFLDCLARAQGQQAMILYSEGEERCKRCGGRGVYGGGTLTGGRHYDLPCSMCKGRGRVTLLPAARQTMDLALAAFEQLVIREHRHDLMGELNRCRELRARM